MGDIEVEPPAEAGSHARLGAAQAALEAGLTSTARREALVALQQAEALDDKPRQARALVTLAQCDRAAGRLRRAHDAAQRAIRLLRVLGDAPGEIPALAVLAYCASLLGREEEAVEAALLGVRLAERFGTPEQAAVSYNDLGVAYLCNHSFAQADAALARACRFARDGLAPHRALQPMLNLAWVEIVRMAKVRYQEGALPAAGELARRVEACMPLAMDDEVAAMLPGQPGALRDVARATIALAWAWSGRGDQAATLLDELPLPQRVAVPVGLARMHAVIECWVRTELAWAGGRYAAAERHAQDMIVYSEHADWEQMAYVAHLLLAQLHELQGRPRDALAEHRALRRREQRVRAERMESRYHVVQAQLDVLDTRQNLAHMARYSQELERLSYEDALTGLPNRRRFDMALAELLADGFEEHAPHCVAVVDLDRFKQVNDRHSHLVGDQVLRAVARVLHAAVRQSDLAARYAGDEFVVLFPRTTLGLAQQVCERIRRSVDLLVVPAATGPVRVTVSVGVAQADRDEGPADVLHRADVAMYAEK